MSRAVTHPVGTYILVYGGIYGLSMTIFWLTVRMVMRLFNIPVLTFIISHNLMLYKSGDRFCGD